jgi:hypothetical protein
MTGIKPETLRVRRFRARAQIARQVQEQTGEPMSKTASKTTRMTSSDQARDGAPVRRARRPSVAHRP